MIVTVLGTSSPYPRPGNPCSSFLVQGSGTRLWLDTGSGSFASLLEHCSLLDLDAIWLSHTHADHFSDLPVVFYALRYAGISRPPVPVYGPPGWGERLRAVLSHHSTPSPVEAAFEIHEVSDAEVHAVGALMLTTVEVRHDVPCFGVRIGHDDRVVSFTGDTAPCGGLDRLALGADLLISEAGYGTGEPPDNPAHLTATQAGDAAARGGAKALLLTHLEGSDPDSCVQAAVAAGADRVLAATPGLALTVPHADFADELIH